MYVATVPNRNSPPAVLLRESFRDNGKVRNRTLANLSDWPAPRVEALRRALRGEAAAAGPESFEIVRSRPHGHVAAVMATMERLELPAMLGPDCRQRRAALALIASRLLRPASKLSTSRALRSETAQDTLGESLGLGQSDEDDLYAAMDWLQQRQPSVERELARRHLGDSTLTLYDVTSTYFEGRHCPLARFGYSRDERRSNPQIVVGLLTNGEGCPVAEEVFEGNLSDPQTVARQVEKLRQRFGLQRLVLVGDRGMLTERRIEQELRGQAGLEWLTALRSPQIAALAAEGAIQLSLFDERDLVEITHPGYPGERLVVCRNPLLAAARKRKRQELMAAAEKKLAALVEATQRKRQPLRGAGQISYQVGRALATSKVAKYFAWEAGERGLSWSRLPARIERDARLDGIYVLRTNLARKRLDSNGVVESYKRLAQVERAFRCLKSLDLRLRPIHHRVPDRVRAHVLVAMLGYYVEWHMRRRLAPLLFDDEHGGAPRVSPVAPAERSAAALAKAERKRTASGLPVQSFRDWLKDLATITKNTIQPAGTSVPPFQIIARPTPLQQHALALLGTRL